jgi:DNA invertase Pin-like site-specific DNA recombinase
VRQSSLRQVFENSESTKRQYDLRQRAVALGWSIEQVIVIDSDLGQSGASAVDRAGFQLWSAFIRIATVNAETKPKWHHKSDAHADGSSFTMILRPK